MKVWIYLLLFQLAVGANAGMVFSHLPRGWAGLVAGTGFILFGAAALHVFWRHSLRFQFFNVFVAGFFLLGLSVPMALARIFTPFDRPVQTVFGMDLQTLHQPSLYVFNLLMALAVIQLGLVIKEKITARKV